MAVAHPITVGQDYEDDRTGDVYRVLFENDDVVMLRHRENHGLENRRSFEIKVEEGRFNLIDDAPDPENLSTEEIPLGEIDLIGETAVESLKRAGLTTPLDFARAGDKRILECDAVGEKGLENIREWVENNG